MCQKIGDLRHPPPLLTGSGPAWSIRANPQTYDSDWRLSSEDRALPEEIEERHHAKTQQGAQENRRESPQYC